jgi:hypothetical protein
MIEVVARALQSSQNVRAMNQTPYKHELKEDASRPKGLIERCGTRSQTEKQLAIKAVL